MSLVVYEMKHSPFCLPVTQALTSLGVLFDRVEVPNWDRSSVMALTDGAYYEVPTLLHDGSVIYETDGASQDIARYVEAQWGAGRLFPEATAGIQEILISHVEEKVEDVTFKLVDPPYVDAIANPVDRANVVRHKERRFGRGCVEAWRRDRDALRAEADRLLDRFERTLAHSPFLLGDVPVYVDFALFGIVGNLTCNGYNRLGLHQQAIQGWADRLEAFRYG